MSFFDCRRPVSRPISVRSVLTQQAETRSQEQRPDDIETEANDQLPREEANDDQLPREEANDDQLPREEANDDQLPREETNDENTNGADPNTRSTRNNQNIQPPRARYNQNRRNRISAENDLQRRSQMREYEILGGVVNLVNQGEVIKLSKNPQISGFQISIGPLLDEYSQKTSNSCLLMEDLKSEITDLITRKIRMLEQ